jgi:PAP2 superfamily
MSGLARHLRRTYSLEAELAIVAAVLVTWHAVRIPLEGDVATSLAHAHDVLRLERWLGIDLEQAVIEWIRGSDAEAVLAWLYLNLHLPVLFGFIAATRLLAPDRYPAIRTTFVLSFVPAVAIIGLYPLAPPHWLTTSGLGGAPSEGQLTDTTGALFHNTTAAAASQHFGFAVLVAAASIWLFPRSPLAYTTIAYPMLVFVVIVGTGNHYVVDCLVGTLTFVFAAAIAARIHKGPFEPATYCAGTASIALGYGVVTWGFVSLDLTEPASLRNLVFLLVVAAGCAAVIAPRAALKDPVTES